MFRIIKENLQYSTWLCEIQAIVVEGDIVRRESDSAWVLRKDMDYAGMSQIKLVSPLIVVRDGPQVLLMLGSSNQALSNRSIMMR